MSHRLCVTPSGRLVIEPAPNSPHALDEATTTELTASFRESSAHGLLWLCSNGVNAALAPPLVFWRDFGQRFFQDVCHLGEEGAIVKNWRRLPPPPETELESMVSAAPPMRGLEYLTPGLLAALWGELQQLVVTKAASHAGGPREYLRDLNPIWHLLGKVTLHLAENKRDVQRPFAFLATYSRRLSHDGRLQHLPLGQALKEYAGEKNRGRLTALLEPVQAAADQSSLIRELLDSRELFQPQAWSVRQAYRFLKEAPLLETAGVVVRLPDWWTPRQPPRPQVRVRLGEKRASQLGLDGLLEFSTELALDGEPLTDAERRQLLESTDGLVLLRGRWVEANPEKLQEAIAHWQELQSLNPDGISFVEGMRLLSGARLDAKSEDESTAEWSQLVSGDWLRETLAAIRHLSEIDSLQPGRDLHATLRSYQVDGVRWLWLLSRLRLGACLADDMGLGKTIQVIDLLLQMKREVASRNSSRRPTPSGSGETQLSLLVVPASLLGNWRQELSRFAPSLRVFYAHPSESVGDTLSQMEQAAEDSLRDIDVVVTTYGLVRQKAWLQSIAWRLVVIDEAQAIKNPASTQAKAVKKLRAQARIALTGTPVENQLGDLWSIFDFCCPGLLGTATQFKQFVKRLNRQQDAAAFGALRRLVQPYILRRLKTDPGIVPDLPEKTEMRAECGLSKKQAVLYEQAVSDLARRLEKVEGIARRGVVLATLMQLKQICNHPAQSLNQTDFPPRDSGKFQRLAELCEPIVERQEKTLVFTQFQSMCQPLAHHLNSVFGRPGLILSGKTPVRRRPELVEQFQQEGGPPFFVISLKAGGSGLNLTAASHVVHFDRWWNPAVENQATDRAFRIGQRRNVFVHKFVCRGTVEERIDLMMSDKQRLADRLLSPEGEPLLTEMSDEELLSFVAIDLNKACPAE